MLYLVISEEWYGDESGDMVRLFESEEDAEIYKMRWIAKTRGTVDVIVKKITLVMAGMYE